MESKPTLTVVPPEASPATVVAPEVFARASSRWAHAKHSVELLAFMLLGAGAAAAVLELLQRVGVTP